ncbi:MAG: pilus assembly FimT family protein [Silanimonas sp.]
MKYATRAAGFTLIEALVVLALMATAFALFAGALVGALPGQQLRDATHRLAAEMRATRARAVATGVDQSFVIDTQARTWHSGASESAIDDMGANPGAAPPPGSKPANSRSTARRSGELDDALALGATVAREEQPGPGIAAIRFFADGSSTGGRVVVRRGDAAWRVDVNWLTGAVRVERGEGGR